MDRKECDSATDAARKVQRSFGMLKVNVLRLVVVETALWFAWQGIVPGYCVGLRGKDTCPITALKLMKQMNEGNRTLPQ